MWELRQKMVTTPEVQKCISSAKWFSNGLSTCVFSTWYLHPRLDVTPITGHLKSPFKNILSKKATFFFQAKNGSSTLVLCHYMHEHPCRIKMLTDSYTLGLYLQSLQSSSKSETEKCPPEGSGSPHELVGRRLVKHTGKNPGRPIKSY